MKMRSVLAALAALCLTTGAHAQAYVGGGLGAGKLNLGCEGTASCDTSGVASKLFGGYMFTPTWGIEGAVVNFGKASATGVVSGRTVGLDVTHKTLALALSGRHSFSPTWSLVSRLGLASNKATAVGRSSGMVATETKTSAALYASLGVAYSVDANLSVEASLESTTFRDPDNFKYGAVMGGIAARYAF